MSSVIRPRSNSCPNLNETTDSEKFFPDSDPFIPDIKDRCLLIRTEQPQVQSTTYRIISRLTKSYYVPLEIIFASTMR